MEFPQIDPIIFHIGPLSLHWYGLMYVLGFGAAYLLGKRRTAVANAPFTSDQVSDFLFYGFLGVLLGGRIGYVCFYQIDLFLADPLYLFKVWDGGMSFHGGLIGVSVAFFWFSKKTHQSLFTVSDFFAPLVPPGLFFGRIGNFINGELWGREAGSDVPWAMRFPSDSAHLLRHPSQLYEALLEGLLLFLIVYIFSIKSRPRMAVTGLFALSYGIFRFIVEFFREPDANLGLRAFELSRGQWLCLPMIIFGIILLFAAYQKRNRI